jgi:hypothetical protein
MGSRTIRRPCCTTLSSIEGIPSGRSLPLLFGIYVRRTAVGQYVPFRNLSESRRIRGKSTSSAVRLSTPGVRLPLLLRISSQAWLSHSSVMIFSQSLGKRVSWFSPASLCKCSISLATLITDFLRGVAYCYPLLLLVERLVYSPLRPVSGSPGLPGWS